jgi:hypothetical protein
MIVRLRKGMLVVTPEEGDALADWLNGQARRVFWAGSTGVTER